MTDDRKTKDGPSPSDKEPAEGSRQPGQSGPGSRPPGHLGPAGDPVEGKEPR